MTLSSVETLRHLESRINESATLREIFGWIEWREHRDAVVTEAIDSMQYRPLAKCQAPRVDTILSIQLGVSTRLGVTRETQCSNDRHHLPTLARHVAMYLCRKLTSASLSDIQRAFNCNDHSTVVSAIKRIELMRAKDPKIDALIVELSQ